MKIKKNKNNNNKIYIYPPYSYYFYNNKILWFAFNVLNLENIL